MSLLGNPQLNYRISGIMKTGKISHCYLISGPEGSGKHTLAKHFAAAIQCVSQGEKPCGRCPQCRKVLSDIHPDLISVDDREHKQLPVKLVKDIVADAFILPNEGKKKIYLFDHAEKLSQQGQNTLLKILEEPPAHAVFFLLVPNANLLLPTVRSRCQELALSPLPRDLLISELRKQMPGHSEEEYRTAASCGYLGKAQILLKEPEDKSQGSAFVDAFCSGSRLSLLEFLTPYEKTDREKLAELFRSWRILLIESLAGKYGQGLSADGRKLLQKRSARELMDAADALSLSLQELDANGNTAAVCAGLAIRLSGRQ